jgi:hypothetical protein
VEAGPDREPVSQLWSPDETPLFALQEVPLVPYLNLDDRFADHPKNDALSDGAFRLQVAALCYAAKNLTDGFVERRRVHRLVPAFKQTYVQELLDSGHWTEAPAGDGFQLHDYLDWNKSKAWWLEHREKEAKRIAAWRARQRDAAANAVRDDQE